ncbi:MAG: tyrosine--tRNA ligase, partial [bacterium]
KRLRAQAERMGLLRFTGRNHALLVNNYDWLSKVRLLEDFMLDLGRSFSVKELLAMETFAKRLGDTGAGLTLLEFLYPILQAYDFLYLFREYDCRLQIGGSDQWGNILQGTDLIRRVEGKRAFALTFPLLTTSGGEKMGKSEAGTIWLDAELTSPFDLFQYLQGLDDGLVASMLSLLTFLPLDEVETTISNPRGAQVRLATEVTRIVHGDDVADSVLNAFRGISHRDQEKTTASLPTFQLPQDGLELDEVLTASGEVASKAQVRRLCEQQAIWVNDDRNNRILDPKQWIADSCVIRFGKGKFLKVEL